MAANFDLSNPLHVKAAVAAGLRRELGRWPTPEEVRATILTYLVNH